MNKQFITNRNVVKFFVLSLLLLSTVNLFAQQDFSYAIEEASNTIKGFWGKLKTLVLLIGGVSGIVGGVRIYNKWSNGDPDINKEILSWGGAIIFLIVVPVILGAVFGI